SRQSRFPGGCKSRSRNDPPRSAEDALRPRFLTGENGLSQSFHPVLRRRDDPTNPQSDRRPMGAVSILRGGLALELSPSARNAPIRDPLHGSHDLVTPYNRAR